MRRAILAAVLLLGALALPAHAAGRGPCTDRTGAVPYAVGDHTGFVAYPDQAPKALVVFFHGINHQAEDWAQNHLERVADESRAVTVAMDYGSKLTDVDGSWQVQEGATASIAAAEALRRSCRSVRTVVAYGVSMGGNASGLAVAQSDVWDHWIAVEGAHNVVETYLEASALAPAVPIASAAKAGIEQEMGGATFAEDPATYVAHTNVANAAAIAAHVQDVVLVHGLDDGLVPHDQSREMQVALGDEPLDFTTVFTKGEGEPGTTIDGYAIGDQSPFAGHANEDSTTHAVGVTGFAKLRELLATGAISPGEHAVP